MDKDGSRIQGTFVFVRVIIENAAKKHTNPGRVKEFMSWDVFNLYFNAVVFNVVKLLCVLLWQLCKLTLLKQLNGLK